MADSKAPVAFTVEFPKVEGLDQHEEWCSVVMEGERRTFRFHDYAQIFDVPGLYEELFSKRLKCNSPKVLTSLLGAALERAGEPASSLRGIDLGAGNGMVGEELRGLGVPTLVAVDLLPEAARAAERDRPGVYADYVVADVTVLSDKDRMRLLHPRPNLLSSVAALGFGDLPAAAFASAWNLIETPGWVMFNIKEDFLSEKYRHGFSRLVRRMMDDGVMAVHVQEAYCHRLALDGTQLNYLAFIGKKLRPIPQSWMGELGE